LDSQIGTATIHDTAKDAGATPFNYVKQLIQESFSSMTVPDTTTNRTTHQWMTQVLAQVVSLHRLIKHTQTLQASDQGLVDDRDEDGKTFAWSAATAVPTPHANSTHEIQPHPFLQATLVVASAHEALSQAVGRLLHHLEHLRSKAQHAVASEHQATKGIDPMLLTRVRAVEEETKTVVTVRWSYMKALKAQQKCFVYENKRRRSLSLPLVPALAIAVNAQALEGIEGRNLCFDFFSKANRSIKRGIY
jgi:hypothetical protein